MGSQAAAGAINVLKLMDRPIAFQRSFVRLGIGVTGALMLSQAVYWAQRSHERGGWFYKSQAEWEEETGLKRTEQERARKALKAIGVLEEKREGLPARLFFRVDTEKLSGLLGGECNNIDLEQVLDLYESTLRGLSKTGLMRAQKAGAKVEYVEYADVLKEHGLVCGCCGEAISYGPGQSPDSLAFDHTIPIAKGGDHVKANIRPTHARCNYSKADKVVSCNETSSSTVDNQDGLVESSQDGLVESDSAAYPKHAITEITSETTAEITEKYSAPEAEPVDDETASADAADGILESDPDDDVYVTKRGKQLRGELLERFEQFWAAFDYRKGKAEAADAWLAKVPWTKSAEQNNALLARILLAAEFEAMQRPAKVAMKVTPIYPEGWLSGRRWEDETVDLAANQAAGSKAGKRDAITAALMDIHDTSW